MPLSQEFVDKLSFVLQSCRTPSNFAAKWPRSRWESPIRFRRVAWASWRAGYRWPPNSFDRRGEVSRYHLYCGSADLISCFAASIIVCGVWHGTWNVKRVFRNWNLPYWKLTWRPFPMDTLPSLSLQAFSMLYVKKGAWEKESGDEAD